MNRRVVGYFFAPSFLLSLSLLLLSPLTASACDLCATYTPATCSCGAQCGCSDEAPSEPFALGVAEQFSFYGTKRESGRYAENMNNEHLASSITQIFGSYRIDPQFTVQANLPYINRRFSRVEDASRQRGTEAGVGDLTLLVRYEALRLTDGERSLRANVWGGVKLPTGDSDRLGDELAHDHGGDLESISEPEMHSDGDEHHEDGDEHLAERSAVLRHGALRHGGEDHEGGEESIIHGHDLALGSGSYDFPLGAEMVLRSGGFGVTGELQYVIRNEGDFDYRYANDLIWSVTPSATVATVSDTTVEAGLGFSGEYKRKDSMNGARQDDTGIRSLFVGPELAVNGKSWGAVLAWDHPLEVDNTGVQAVVDYRLRAAMTARF